MPCRRSKRRLLSSWSTSGSQSPESPGTRKGHGSTIVYQPLRDCGYEVFAVNPNADEVEGDDLKSIPGGVDAVVIATRPETAMRTMKATTTSFLVGPLVDGLGSCRLRPEPL